MKIDLFKYSRIAALLMIISYILQFGFLFCGSFINYSICYILFTNIIVLLWFVLIAVNSVNKSPLRKPAILGILGLVFDTISTIIIALQSGPFISYLQPNIIISISIIWLAIYLRKGSTTQVLAFLWAIIPIVMFYAMIMNITLINDGHVFYESFYLIKTILGVLFLYKFSKLKTEY